MEGRTTTERLVGALRIVLSGIFLWAFFDKLLGLGFSTKPQSAWIAGGSPTYGFLTRGATGALGPFFHSLAGNALVDGLFMVGLLGIGASLLLGIGLRIAAWSGALLMFLMWLALVPTPNNPLLDDHVVYALLLLLLPRLKAGEIWGISKWWSTTPLVRRLPILE